MRLGLYLWDLMLSPGRWGQIELNFRTPSWYLRVAWWCGRKKKTYWGWCYNQNTSYFTGKNAVLSL